MRKKNLYCFDPSDLSLKKYFVISDLFRADGILDQNRNFDLVTLYFEFFLFEGFFEEMSSHGLIYECSRFICDIC